MSDITGKLLADLHPNGTVRMVFIARTGGGNECPITAKNLDAAEVDFVKMCGLTPERAAALRAELDRNKVVSAEPPTMKKLKRQEPVVAREFQTRM